MGWKEIQPALRKILVSQSQWNIYLFVNISYKVA